jgi:hypothetical protein
MWKQQMNGLQVYQAKRLNVMVDGNAGKGSKYRPVNQKKYAENWDAAFGNKTKSSNVDKPKKETTNKEKENENE